MSSSIRCDIGYKSILHDGEQLCGDHVQVVEHEDSTVIVLADGLSSGVKASILSTLTSKIISTMIAAGLPIEDCVETIASTLPVDAQKNVAYSTFSIIHVVDNKTADIFQFDNPPMIFLRNGKSTNYPKKEVMIGGKKIIRSTIRLRENDTFVLMSDGCPNASLGLSYNYNWQVSDITAFMETYSQVGYTAKTLATMLVDECYEQYGHKPLDDATACVVRMCPRVITNLIFGPPSDKSLDKPVLDEFFGKEGRHIVCGGTTSNMVSHYLDKPLKSLPHTGKNGIPPISELAGVDLVTEGVVTLQKVYEYAKDALKDNELYKEWGFNRDGASLLCRKLFEESTDVNLYIGKAVNLGYEMNQIGIDFNYKMHLAQQLADSLKEMGKKVTIQYF